MLVVRCFSNFVAIHDFCTTTKAPATYTRYHCYAPDSVSTLKEVKCIDMLLSTFWTMCQIFCCLIPPNLLISFMLGSIYLLSVDSWDGLLLDLIRVVRTEIGKRLVCDHVLDFRAFMLL
jgi:hypothetical protein